MPTLPAQREHDKLLADAQKELQDLAVTATESWCFNPAETPFDQFLNQAERGEPMRERIQKAVLHSAVEPTEAQKKRFEAFLRKKYGQAVLLQWEQDAALENGFPAGGWRRPV